MAAKSREARERAAVARYLEERSTRLAREREERREREEDRRALRGYVVAWAPERREAAGIPAPAPRQARPTQLPPSTVSVDLQPLPGGGRGKGFWSFGRQGLDAPALSAAASIHDQWERSGLARAGAIPEARILWQGEELGAIDRETWEEGPRAIAESIREMLEDRDLPRSEPIAINIPPASWDYPEEG